MGNAKRAKPAQRPSFPGARAGRPHKASQDRPVRVAQASRLCPQLKAGADLFLSGKSACLCRIWLGGMLSSDGISYAEGQWHHESNACNEILSVSDTEGELYMISLMGMGFGQLERQFDLKRMSQEQAAGDLWRRFVAPLER